MRTTNRRSVLATITVAAMGGCLYSPAGRGTAPTTTDEQLSGTIRVAGSSTVYPVTVAVGEAFSNRHQNVTVSVSSTGTGGGFDRFFCDGRTEINDASRTIQPSEERDCAQSGVEPVAFQVATDALTVVVNNDADWVDCVTLSDLRAIWAEGAAETWSDVHSSWADDPITLHGPSSDSGTYDYFDERVLQNADHRSDYVTTEQDSTIVEAVSNDEYAIGYLGFAYYAQNEDAVRALSVEADGECVPPSLETAKLGGYPLSRPLYIYVDEEALSDPTVAAFLRYYVERSATDLVQEVGYVPVSEQVRTANRERLDELVA